jgi:hypothetical protein
MTARQVRTAARFATLNVVVAAWFILPFVAILTIVKAVGL